MNPLPPPSASAHGFTLIELVVTLAVVGVLAMIALPLAEIGSTRARESELRLALRQIRTALDAYKAAADLGTIPKGLTESGYPPSLEALTVGVENPKDLRRGPSVFLRNVPRDPFADPALPAAQTWDVRAYGNRPGDLTPGADVFDVSSRSARIGLNGVAYKDW